MATNADVDKILKDARRAGYTLVLDRDERTILWADLHGGLGVPVDLSNRVRSNYTAVIDRLRAELADRQTKQAS